MPGVGTINRYQDNRNTARKTKWKTKLLIVGCYHPPSQNDNDFFHNLSKALPLDSLNSNYEKFLLVGDFNSQRIMKLKLPIF